MTAATSSDGIQITEGADAIGRYQDITICGVVQRMRWIPEGQFLMGSPEDESDRHPGFWPTESEVQRLVKIESGFWLADTTCTQALYRAVTGKNPSRFNDPTLPVERVSWNDVKAFVQRLNEIQPGAGFRLPTEAEWEYACRAGTTTAYSFGDAITKEQVNFRGESTLPVKSLPENPWGLHEMHGNVWEWCEDESAPGLRALRGGSWFSSGRYCLSAGHNANGPDALNRFIGFRLARGVY